MFTQTIKYTKTTLKTWNKTYLKNCGVHITNTLNEIDELQRKEPAIQNRQAEVELHTKAT